MRTSAVAYNMGSIEWTLIADETSDRLIYTQNFALAALVLPG